VDHPFVRRFRRRSSCSVSEI